MDKALLIRVGADSGNSKILSPVFPQKDNEFVFLPLGDNSDGIKINSTTKVYNKELLPYLGEDVPNSWLHLDPYFNEEEKIYTYGDRTHSDSFNSIPQKQKLLQLENGDYLFFCGTFLEMDKEDYKICNRNEIIKKQKIKQKHLYLFGYFKVKEVHTINSETPMGKKDEIANLHINNAHIIRRDHFDEEYLPKEHPEKKLILILGNSVGSKLLKKAIKLTNCKDGTHYLEEKWISYFNRKDFGSSIGLHEWIKNPKEFIEEIEKLQ